MGLVPAPASHLIFSKGHSRDRIHPGALIQVRVREGNPASRATKCPFILDAIVQIEC